MMAGINNEHQQITQIDLYTVRLTYIKTYEIDCNNDDSIETTTINCVPPLSGRVETCIIDQRMKIVPEYSFHHTEFLENLIFELPSSLITIERNAFSQNRHLRQVIFPQGLLHIQDNAFDGCSNLQVVIFPETLITIGSRAFYNCSNIQGISLPDSVKCIGKQAFENSLSRQIIIPETIESVSSNSFGNFGIGNQIVTLLQSHQNTLKKLFFDNDMKTLEESARSEFFDQFIILINENDSLEELSLQRNNLTADQLFIILQQVGSKTNLKHLNLKHNNRFSWDRFSDIKYESSNLQSLRIDHDMEQGCFWVDNGDIIPKFLEMNKHLYDVHEFRFCTLYVQHLLVCNMAGKVIFFDNQNKIDSSVFSFVLSRVSNISNEEKDIGYRIGTYRLDINGIYYLLTNGISCYVDYLRNKIHSSTNRKRKAD